MTPDDKTLRRYGALLRLLEDPSAADGERRNARQAADRLEAQHPRIRAHYLRHVAQRAAQEAAEQRTAGWRGPRRPGEGPLAELARRCAAWGVDYAVGAGTRLAGAALDDAIAQAFGHIPSTDMGDSMDTDAINWTAETFDDALLGDYISVDGGIEEGDEETGDMLVAEVEIPVGLLAAAAKSSKKSRVLVCWLLDLVTDGTEDEDDEE